MTWVILGVLAAAFVAVILAACKTAVEEDQLLQMHPPDDDGVSLLDDPDGQYTR